MDSGGESPDAASCWPATPTSERKHVCRARSSSARGWSGSARSRSSASSLTNVPGDYIRISSGLGEAPPLNIVVLPVLFEGEVKAVIELASFDRFSEIHLTFLDQLTESHRHRAQHHRRQHAHRGAAQAVAVARRRAAAQQQELTETNERLEQQARSLQASEELLKQQQEELQQTNEELEEQGRSCSEQNAEVERKNREIEQAKMALEEKAEQLALTSKYKSEFLRTCRTSCARRSTAC